MKQKIATLLGIALFYLFSFQGLAQKKTMNWSTKSEPAKALALDGGGYMMNIEFAQAYDKFNQALKLDPDFTVALTLMASLSNGAVKKTYSDKALASAAGKSSGEQLFATLSKPGNKPEENRKIWADLRQQFPDGGFINFFYVLTRATPEEQFAAAQEYQVKFTDVAAIHNILGYGYLQVKKDTLNAKKHFEKYIQMYPDGCNPYDSMGEFYFNSGDMENAEKYYTMALEKYPFNNSSIEKLGEIKAVKNKAKTQ
jgi:Tfp pilus assembly protein PilF